MRGLVVALWLLVLCARLGTAQADGLGKIRQHNYSILPDWCDVVYVTKDGEKISELRLGEVFTFTNIDPSRIGYECRQLGHGGSATHCGKSKFAHVIYGLNIEGRKEKKISVLCIE